jgi:hypothetical protein
MDYYRVGFRAEYPERGFGITRLVPVYDYSLPPFKFYSETAPNDLEQPFQAPVASINQMPPRVIDDLKPSIHPENLDEESSYDEEIWSRLPAWARILADLKRRARQTRAK